MRKSLFLVALSLWLAGCGSNPPAQEAKAGLGIVPLNGATLTGKVVEASQPDGVLVKTQSDRSFLLPQDWEYRSGGKTVPVKDLVPGSTVTAVAPAGESRLVSAADNTLVLGSENGFFSFPVEGLSDSARAVPVQVQTTGGQSWDMPLGQAVSSYPAQIVSHPYYNDYDFPVADPYMVHKGLPVGAYGESPLLLAPGPGGAQLVQLPAMYPRQQLVSHQPVRFTYADNNVAVSSWNTLGDGQFDLGKLLLAGTLLDVLPGQAIIEVGQNPVAVPWNYVTYQGAPIGQRRFPVGTQLGIQYHPGVYDMVSYDYDNVTFMYNHQPVQVPISYLPDYSYRQRVKIRRPHGQWVGMPFQAAQPLLATGDYWVCPSPVAQPYMDYWRDDQWAWQPRPVRGRPDFRLVGHSGFGPPRVMRWDNRRDHHRPGRSWWDRQADWAYTAASWAGPAAAWSYGSHHRPWERDRGGDWDDRRFGYGGPKHHGGKDHKRFANWNGGRDHRGDRDRDRSWGHGPKGVAYWDRGSKKRFGFSDHKRGDRQVAWGNNGPGRGDGKWDGDRRRGGERREGKDWRPDQRRGDRKVAWNHGPQKRGDHKRGDQKWRNEQRRGGNERRVSQRPQQQQRQRQLAQRPQQRQQWRNEQRRGGNERRVSQRPQQQRQRQVAQRPQQRQQRSNYSQRPQQRQQRVADAGRQRPRMSAPSQGSRQVRPPGGGGGGGGARGGRDRR